MTAQLPPDEEKRSTGRIGHVVPVTVRIQSCPGHHGLEGTVLEGTTRDISLNGIRLHLNRVLPVHTSLEVEINFSDHRYLLAGNVIWAQMKDQTHGDVGMLFSAVDESQMWSWRMQMARVGQLQ